ncbi:Rieske (2Fe-2S) protein [Paenibacillus sp. TRM 82003]|uniref:Rieske 2Fe-2S domain-containing protein n=1 Tax=Kineococcus sp. TRM81007 TaxID=2925831 RepID=UPI001F573978|nr:Rieske (2Fe-2S) protein [Kineococcus sp. TRM81007]MCI2238194.1 Rieske (2Fe-2S) protein [Kineococcus sp. TRM81007]MCI3920578.1 Rieske (2Fe-2S) protein [Paenibacillus sp. TRM 82003]
MTLIGTLFDAPSRLTALDPVASRAKGLADRLLPGGRVRGLLHGRPFGHPAHPAMALVPVGTSISALLLDAAAAVLPAGRALDPAARYLTATAAASAVPTAIAGWADYTGLHVDQQRTALVHATGNAVAVTCWGASLVAGRRAALLRTAGTLAAGAAGALGGHLAYRWAAGPNHAEHLPHLAGDEHADIGALEELPDGELTRRHVGDAPVCVLRRGSSVRALADTCSHLGAGLHGGQVREGAGGPEVVCPWHGSAFRFDDGAVVDGPAASPQPTVDVRVADGRVLARVDGPPAS